MEEKKPIKQARLDFFLISESLLNLSLYVKYENSYRSDHCPVVLCVRTNEFLKGKGFWKFNNSLLKDKEYVYLIKEKIKYVKQQYACPVYNFENIEKLDDNNIQFIISDQSFLDTLLMEIRGKSISYSTYKKKKTTELEKKLEQEILLLEQNFTEESKDELSNKQTELELIRKKKQIARSMY